MEKTINERIKDVRTALKLSQREFSKGIYLEQSSYARIEQCIVPANERVLELICTVYKVNKTYLKNGKGTMFRDKSADHRLEELNRVFNELNNFFQDYLITQAKELLKVQKKQED